MKLTLLYVFLLTLDLFASFGSHPHQTFDILDAYTYVAYQFQGGVHRFDRSRYRWWSNVSSFPNLDGQTKSGPTFAYEYSTREAYGANIKWGANDPLNATWWHLVTERAFRVSRS